MPADPHPHDPFSSHTNHPLQPPNPFDKPPAQARLLSALIAVAILVLVMVITVVGFLWWQSSRPVPVAPALSQQESSNRDQPPQTPATVTSIVTVAPTPSTPSVSPSPSTSTAAEPDAEAQAAARAAGLGPTGWGSLACVGEDLWVFAAVSPEDKHVLMCRSAQSGEIYYTHDYLTETYRKRTDKADTAAGVYEVWNDDALITVTPQGVTVQGYRNDSFSSTFSTSFQLNPWAGTAQ